METSLSFETLMNVPLPPEVQEGCRAMRTQWNGRRREDGLCVVCLEPLPTRRYRFCSDACGTWFNENHAWTNAKAIALRINRETNFIEVRSVDRWTDRKDFSQQREWVSRTACCSRCHLPETGNYGSFEWLQHRLEVDHIYPVNGGNRQMTCLNHQENLRVVCHGCHLILTAEQRQMGLIGKKATNRA